REPRLGARDAALVVPPCALERAPALGEHSVGRAAAQVRGRRRHRTLDGADLGRLGGSGGRRAIPPRAGVPAHSGRRGAVVARRVGGVLGVVCPPAAAAGLRGARTPARLVPAGALPSRSAQTPLRRLGGGLAFQPISDKIIVSRYAVGGSHMYRTLVLPLALALVVSRCGAVAGPGGYAVTYRASLARIATIDSNYYDNGTGKGSSNCTADRTMQRVVAPAVPATNQSWVV